MVITDWLMVGLTTLYVIATIFICIYNYRSAKATREQTKESIRQFNEINRPYIQVYLDALESDVFVLMVKNTGNIIAREIEISIDEEFLDGVVNSKTAEHLRKLTQRKFNLASGQEMSALICPVSGQDTILNKQLSVRYSYKNDLNTKQYIGENQISLEEYHAFLKFKSNKTQIAGYLKNMDKCTEKVTQSLCRVLDKIDVYND